MARTRKHSKKKKVSSEGYRQKKSRRNKSKKLRHHHDSFSSPSDDESTSEGEYERKRARSRSRNETKKRNRTSESPPVKKRKRSKKIKKKKKKKNYITSASSDSGSCSTCKDEDSSSDEMASHGENKKDHRDSTKARIGNMRTYISPTTSCYESIQKVVTMENNPMRLKSVITVANLENEDMKNNGLKEETVYDYDDYPSSQTNDSFNTSPDKKSVVKEVNSGSNLDDDIKEKESNVSGNIGSEADNLELILRQKALENLSRFRGGIKVKPLVSVDETVSMSQPVINRSRFTWRRDPSVTTAKDGKAATYSETLSSGSQPAELKFQTANLSSTSRVDDTNNIMVNTNSVETAVVETPSSASIKEGSSKEQQNESNDNLQFEKKTMSVMRGGEMVQVSYKVYIPNRSPALARRQLKR
ncbi:hypothetical protein L1987_84589 [Smallanthus sonchifolius]|uniref:Uncharacterized protein n=1 Tax=Smallanthus sonchifolius TaxID=185202 RepID=A0ACB8XU38_9ASTR|nr:hypothetical protein L1987_84589 [Smallanthus sonchifolius]